MIRDNISMYIYIILYTYMYMTLVHSGRADPAVVPRVPGHHPKLQEDHRFQ